MKNFKIVLLILTFGITNLSAEGFNQNEYNQLILQCQAIRARIVQQNSFDVIRQSAIGIENEINARLASQFSATSNSSPYFPITSTGSTALNSGLKAQEAMHNVRIGSLIVNTIAAFLNTINTPTSRQLLANLIANGFSF
jgi:hypothetical protein